MRLLVVLQVLLSHWMYRPVQFFSLLIGLTLATGLWTGVQAINTEARSSYEKARTALLPGVYDSLERRDGQPIDVKTYAALQRAGWRTSPVLEGKLQLDDGTVRILAIDPVTMPQSLQNWTRGGGGGEDGAAAASGQGLTGFLQPPYQAIVSPQMKAQLAGRSDLPPLMVSANVPPETLITDLAVAAKLLGRSGQLSRLILAPKQPMRRAQLSEIAPQLEQVENRSAADIDSLTDSFHLNLSAFGMLAFAVGLFIVQGTINLAFEQRRTMCRTLRVTGLTLRTLTLALLLELLVIAIFAGGLGVVLGYVIAALLLPDVAVTLRGLYGAQVSGELEFHMGWWVAGLAIAVAGTFLAAFWSLLKLVRMPILATNRPRAWALMSSRSTRLRLTISAALIALAFMLWLWGQGLVVAFAIIGVYLLGVALLLPDAMAALMNAFAGLAKRPVSQWFWADTGQQLPGLSLALMALLLALAANIGVSTMVGSFRLTFNGWLDQRLAAELYVRAANDQQAVELRDWLEGNADVVLPVWSVQTTIDGQSGRLFGFADHTTYRDHWPMLALSPTGWQDVAAGKVALINEQLASRNGIQLGDEIDLGNRRGIAVAGIYSDYGNPRPQAMINVDLLTRWYPQVSKRRFAIRIASQEVPELARKIREKFSLTGHNLVNQASIKQQSQDIFERTFAVTQALNILTLAVAGLAIFTSLLTQSAMRLPQLAPVWTLGLTRSQLAGLELLRALLLAALTMVVALPLGLGLAWLLLAVVNVEAFGWRLPMFLFAFDWLILAAYALLATALAAAIPARRFSQIAPADLVKVFAHER
ncbi:MAG: FtsX-like permease family protein [Rhizobiaceae bacterium]